MNSFYDQILDSGEHEHQTTIKINNKANKQRTFVHFSGSFFCSFHSGKHCIICTILNAKSLKIKFHFKKQIVIVCVSSFQNVYSIVRNCCVCVCVRAKKKSKINSNALRMKDFAHMQSTHFNLYESRLLYVLDSYNEL